VSGSAKRIKELQSIFDSPPTYGKSLDWDGFNVHDAANVFRRYINHLPEPIIPYDYYFAFRKPLGNPRERKDLDCRNRTSKCRRHNPYIPTINRPTPQTKRPITSLHPRPPRGLCRKLIRKLNASDKPCRNLPTRSPLPPRPRHEPPTIQSLPRSPHIPNTTPRTFPPLRSRKTPCRTTTTTRPSRPSDIPGCTPRRRHN